jgi:hypothetical protein
MVGPAGMPADTNGRESRRLAAELQNRQESFWTKRVSEHAAHTGTHEDGRRLSSIRPISENFTNNR